MFWIILVKFANLVYLDSEFTSRVAQANKVFSMSSNNNTSGSRSLLKNTPSFNKLIKLCLYLRSNKVDWSCYSTRNWPRNNRYNCAMTAVMTTTVQYTSNITPRGKYITRFSKYITDKGGCKKAANGPGLGTIY